MFEAVKNNDENEGNKRAHVFSPSL